MKKLAHVQYQLVLRVYKENKLHLQGTPTKQKIQEKMTELAFLGEGPAKPPVDAAAVLK